MNLLQEIHRLLFKGFLKTGDELPGVKDIEQSIGVALKTLWYNSSKQDRRPRYVH